LVVNDTVYVLGTLRPIYVFTVDTLVAGGEESRTSVAVDGDKFPFAIDGLSIYAGNVVNPHKLLIDFSLMKQEGEEKILVNFPYVLKGTRFSDHYIPLKKDTFYPILPLRKELHIKLKNNDSVNDVTGIAVAVWGYPVLAQEKG